MHTITKTTIYFNDKTHQTSNIIQEVENIQQTKKQMKAEMVNVKNIYFNFESDELYTKTK